MVGSRYAWLALLMAWAPPASAQPQGWQDCAGRVIILGTQSQAAGAGFTYWATLSNPGMRPVRVITRLGEAATAAPLRIEAGRMQRLRLGEGESLLSAEDIAAALRLRCQLIQTQP